MVILLKINLIENAIQYDIIYRGAKSLSLKVPDWGIKFIDSINFIPMALAKFPKTFGQDELCKGYFPHACSIKKRTRITSDLYPAKTITG